jgi:hypothetical protein
LCPNGIILCKNHHFFSIYFGENLLKIMTSVPDLRVACKLGREVLDEAFKAVAAGVTTDEIDRIVHEACVDRQCYPSPLNYYQVLVNSSSSFLWTAESPTLPQVLRKG